MSSSLNVSVTCCCCFGTGRDSGRPSFAFTDRLKYFCPSSLPLLPTFTHAESQYSTPLMLMLPVYSGCCSLCLRSFLASRPRFVCRIASQAQLLKVIHFAVNFR